MILGEPMCCEERQWMRESDLRGTDVLWGETVDEGK